MKSAHRNHVASRQMHRGGGAGHNVEIRSSFVARAAGHRGQGSSRRGFANAALSTLNHPRQRWQQRPTARARSIDGETLMNYLA